MNILFISTKFPSMKADNAGGVVVSKSIETLSKFNNIYLYSYINNPYESTIIDTISPFCKEIYTERTNKIKKLFRVSIYFALPNFFAVRFSILTLLRLVEIIKKHKIDAVQIEFTPNGIYAILLRAVFPSLLINYVEHDITVQAYERKIMNNNNFFKRMYYSLELKKLKFFEKKACMSSSNVIVLNKKDELLAGERFRINNIKRINPYYGIDLNLDNNHIGVAEGKNICFVGSMNRPENEDAAIRMITDIFPIIKEKVKDAKLYIIGASPSKKVLDMENDSIIVTGFVDDIFSYMKRCKVSVVPLLYGGGIKIKTLQSLAIGLPVVSSSVGNEGIDLAGECVVEENDVVIFAEKVIKILTDVAYYNELSQKSIEFVKRNFSWELSEKVYRDIYEGDK
jgi:polysaccharide biosynthesis protein PslH